MTRTNRHLRRRRQRPPAPAATCVLSACLLRCSAGARAPALTDGARSRKGERSEKRGKRSKEKRAKGAERNDEKSAARKLRNAVKLLLREGVRLEDIVAGQVAAGGANEPRSPLK